MFDGMLGVYRNKLFYYKTDSMKKYLENDSTFVLFGKEAIDLYNVSLKLLASSTSYVSYKIGAYKDVKRFMKEQKNWDAFLEITESDYLHLKKHAFKSPVINSSTIGKKKFSFINLFKN